MSNCYICNEILCKENASIEHIIINAIGGRLKSKDLLCKKCNEKIGAKADSELAKQLNFLPSLTVN